MNLLVGWGSRSLAVATKRLTGPLCNRYPRRLRPRNPIIDGRLLPMIFVCTILICLPTFCGVEIWIVDRLLSPDVEMPLLILWQRGLSSPVVGVSVYGLREPLFQKSCLPRTSKNTIATRVGRENHYLNFPN